MIKIALSGVRGKGKFVFIDEIDAERICKSVWHLGPGGYAARGSYDTETQKSRPVFMHIDIMGTPPNGFQVDHKNRNKLNNTRENLRFVNQSQNNQNASKRADNKSGYRGVWFDTVTKRWCAAVKFGKTRTWCGRFKSKVLAALAYDKAAFNLYGSQAQFNFKHPNNVQDKALV